jgi:hypothetical protein
MLLLRIFSEVVVIVEGIFDVITPQLLGIAVANLGTNVGRNMATWVFSSFVVPGPSVDVSAGYGKRDVIVPRTVLIVVDRLVPT